MKVRAIEDCHRYLTAGKIYDVVSKSDCGTYCCVVDDQGNIDGFVFDINFEVIEDEPKIEVGSEWLSSNGVTWKVAYFGNHYVVVNKDKLENCVSISKFKGKYTLKPKTVTMYFYERRGGGYDAFDFELGASYNGLAFTREIELP